MRKKKQLESTTITNSFHLLTMIAFAGHKYFWIVKKNWRGGGGCGQITVSFTCAIYSHSDFPDKLEAHILRAVKVFFLYWVVLSYKKHE